MISTLLARCFSGISETLWELSGEIAGQRVLDKRRWFAYNEVRMEDAPV
jgi:hypothetical protein